MTRTAYYEELKRLALLKRAEHKVVTSQLGLREVREIYKTEGITVDLRPLSSTIRAVYMCDDDDPSVLVNKKLPEEPRLFAMVHELKHHYCDREAITRGAIRCGDYNANQTIEIGAEVFAAEFIFPEAEFLDLTCSLQIREGNCSAEDVVRIKRSCQAKVSYTFLKKRLERLQFIEPGAFAKIQFQKLEEEIFGSPIYKQEWFKRARVRKAAGRRSL